MAPKPPYISASRCQLSSVSSQGSTSKVERFHTAHEGKTFASWSNSDATTVVAQNAAAKTAAMEIRIMVASE